MTTSTTRQLEVGPKGLDELDSLSRTMEWPHATRVFLAALGAQTPKVWDDALAKAAAHAYYVQGPATSGCPHLLARAWLAAYGAQCPGLSISFPHVDRVLKS